MEEEFGVELKVDVTLVVGVLSRGGGGGEWRLLQNAETHGQTSRQQSCTGRKYDFSDGNFQIDFTLGSGLVFG